MRTQQFLQTVLGTDGFYCVLAIRGDRRIQKFYSTIDEVVAAAENFDEEGFDAYYALATFKEAGSRKHNNVAQLKAMFLDLDCGPSKEFPNQMLAIDALKAFCKATKLPKPYLVNSGRGVHVYWPLTEAVDANEWIVVAERLKAVCAEHGFEADPAVTSDMSRILRVPNTHNYKDTPPKPVQILVGSAQPTSLSDFAALLGGKLKPVLSTIDLGRDPVFEALLSNTENSFADIARKTRDGRGCAQLKHVIKNQATLSEPMWRAGLSIAKFCVDGDQAAVLMSKDHPTYDPEVMQSKLDNIQGPYTCVKFDEYNPGVCTQCPLWGKIKSPVLLGRKVVEAPTEVTVEVEIQQTGQKKQFVIPTYPTPYFRGRNGGIYIRSVNEEGDHVDECIYHNDFYVSGRLYDSELGEVITLRLHLPNDPVREFGIPVQNASSREELRKVLGKEGMTILGKTIDKLQVYLMKWIDELQAAGAAAEAHKQLGWVGDDMEEFVLGDQLVQGNGIAYNPPSGQTAGLIPAFVPKGTEARSLELLNFYNRPGFELHQFVVASVLGSTLMEFTGLNSLAINLYGKSGVGKTTAMMAGLSIFGDPSLLMNAKNDTHNSRMLRGEVMHNLALCSDEMTNIKPDEASEYVYQMSGGRQKNRMSSNGNTERYRGKPWSLIAISTTNTSLWEVLSRGKADPDAELMRLFEINVNKAINDPALKPITDQLFDDFKRNFGWLGARFIQYVINNREECRTLVREIRDRIDKAAGLDNKHRFWSAGVACAIAANIIGKRVGIIQYDTAKLTEWVVDELKRRKLFIAEVGATPQSILNEYVTENWNNILWIKSTDSLAGPAEDNGLDKLVVPESLPRGKLVARYETDTKKMFLLLKPLKHWCTDQQLNYMGFVKDMQDQMGAYKHKVRIGKGTHMNLPPADVVIVEMPIDSLSTKDGLDDA